MKRREEEQSEDVRALILELFEGFEETSRNSCIITAVRGYGSDGILEVLSTFGFGSVMVMADKTIIAHPFISASFLPQS